jgi:hypothetical protein
MAPTPAAFPFAKRTGGGTLASATAVARKDATDAEDADAKECALCKRPYGKSNGYSVLQDGPQNAGLDERLGCAHWACRDCWHAVGSVRAPNPPLTRPRPHCPCAC